MVEGAVVLHVNMYSHLTHDVDRNEDNMKYRITLFDKTKESIYSIQVIKTLFFLCSHIAIFYSVLSSCRKYVVAFNPSQRTKVPWEMWFSNNRASLLASGFALLIVEA